MNEILTEGDALIESGRFTISQEATDWLTQAALEVLAYWPDALSVPMFHGGSAEEIAAAADAAEKVMLACRVEIMCAIRQAACDIEAAIQREKQADAEIRAEWAKDEAEEGKYHE